MNTHLRTLTRARTHTKERERRARQALFPQSEQLGRETATHPVAWKTEPGLRFHYNPAGVLVVGSGFLLPFPDCEGIYSLAGKTKTKNKNAREGAHKTAAPFSHGQFGTTPGSVHDFVNRRLLVPGSGDDELIVCGNIAAKDG